MDRFDLRLWPGFAQAGGALEKAAWIGQVAVDSRALEGAHSLFIALKGARQDGHHFLQSVDDKKVGYAIVNKQHPCIPSLKTTQLLYVDDPLLALQEIATAYRRSKKVPVLAITGSYGKTLVKDLLASLLSTQYKTCTSPESFNSQIGVALSVLQIQDGDQIALIEAAVSKPHEATLLAPLLEATYGLLTPIGDKYPTSLNGPIHAAKELLSLFHVDYTRWLFTPSTWFSMAQGQAKALFSWDEATAPYARAEQLLPGQPFTLFLPQGSPYQGTIPTHFGHYIELINMATKVAWQLGITQQNLIEVLHKYRLELTRTEIWRSCHHGTFLNESYCQDPQSLEQALRTVAAHHHEGRKVVIFGGLRNVESPLAYQHVGRLFAHHQIDYVSLVGNYPFDPLTQTLSSLRPQTTVLRHQQMEEALAELRPLLRREDTVMVKGAQRVPIETLMEAVDEAPASSLCFINLGAVAHNIQVIRKKLPPNSRLMIMIKALAYGTDALRMARFLQTCDIDIFGLSYVEEAVALKRSGVTQSLFVLNTAPYEVEKAVFWELELAVSEKPIIHQIAQEAKKQKKQIRLHLHVNTGMGRFGCKVAEAVELAEQIHQSPYLQLEGLMTHFACAEEPQEDAFSIQQAETLNQIYQNLLEKNVPIPWRHAANSAAIARFDLPFCNMARLGLAIYGLSASPAVAKALPLRLALSLLARIVALQQLSQGETVSYGRHYRIETAQASIGVLPVGYFDGLHRHYSGKGHLLLHGKQAPMVGNICMDFMMADVTQIPQTQVGDWALIFGEDGYGGILAPEQFAAQGRSIVHELITCLGPRIPRVFLYN